MKNFILLLFLFSGLQMQAQAKWAAQASTGVSTDNDSETYGFSLATRISRLFAKGYFFGQIGTFQGTHVLDPKTGENAYLNKRSTSIVNLDAGVGYFMLNKPKISIGIEMGADLKLGHELWPQSSAILNGHPNEYYVIDDLGEFGVVFGLNGSFKAGEHLWLGPDFNLHLYQDFQMLTGLGINASFRF